ncbi:hypothetical protein FLA105534_03912 [Flavobacterium bizetiae]|nr:hypothetical protein FLA105534_03912 [Flavobacterium bizetiae]
MLPFAIVVTSVEFFNAILGIKIPLSFATTSN